MVKTRRVDIIERIGDLSNSKRELNKKIAVLEKNTGDCYVILEEMDLRGLKSLGSVVPDDLLEGEKK